MILSRTAILQAMNKGLLTISPLDDSQIDKAHIDLHLGGTEDLVIPAKGFVVARTLEHITLSDNLIGFLEGRSGLAQQGISVEQGSTLVEPGSDGTMALEIFNASDTAVSLKAGQPIAKFYLAKLTDTL